MPREFEHDIFLSYGWSGNVADEGDRKWVRTLKEELEKALPTHLGRKPKIFLDINASRAGALTPILEEALDHTKLFLFAVTPGSCRSNWCNWEILRFLDRGLSVATPNEVLLPEDRILGVKLHPVPVSELPAPLQPLVFRPFDLTRPVEGRDETRPAEWGQFEPPAKAEFDRLIIDLAGRLKLIAEHGAKRVDSTGVSVFVGTPPTPGHEQHMLTQLRRDLLLRGHEVIRATPAPGESEADYGLRLGMAIAPAQHSVHILGTPVSALQMRHATQLTATTVFSWGADPRDLAAVIRREGDHHLDQRQPFTDLRTALFQCIDKQRNDKIVAQGPGKKVVIAYCEEDFPQASVLLERLKGRHRLRAQLALPPRESAGQRGRANRELFKEVDAVIVYYSRHEDWMVLTCTTVRKVWKSDPRKRGALVLHPPPPIKDGCDQIDFDTVRLTRADDLAALDEWVRRL